MYPEGVDCSTSKLAALKLEEQSQHVVNHSKSPNIHKIEQ